MKTNFIQKFIDENVKGINSFISEQALDGFTSQIGNIITKVNELKQSLLRTCQLYGEFIPSLLMTGTMPIDEDYSAIISNSNYKQFIRSISSDIGSTIMTSFNNMIQYSNYLNNTTLDGITVTDSDGLAYVIKKVSQEFQYEGETYVSDLVTTVKENINDIHDVLLAHVKDTKSYIFNYAIKDILNYLSDDPQPEPPEVSAIVGGISIFMNALNMHYDNTQSIHYNLYKTVNEFNISVSNQNIDGMLLGLITHFDSGYNNADSSILDKVVYLVSLMYPVVETVNRYTYFGDVLADLVRSDTINNIMLKASELIINGKFSVDTFTDSVTELASNLSSDIMQIVNGIKTSFNSGGVLSVIYYMSQILSSPLSVSFSEEDQKLAFTDNTSLVPQIYFSGIIFKTVTTLVNIVGSIVAQVHPVVGVVIQVVSQIGDWINQAFTYDYDTDTLAQANQSVFNIILPYSHIALWQTEVTADVSDRYIVDYANIVGTFYVEIIGGMLLIGPGSNANSYRMEFHPSVCMYDRQLCGLGVSITVTEDVGQYNTHYMVNVPNNHATITIDWLRMLWETRKPLPVYNADNGDTLNLISDVRLRGSFLESSALFLTYLALSISNTPIVVDNPNNFSIGTVVDDAILGKVWYRLPSDLTTRYKELANLRHSCLALLLSGCMPMDYMFTDDVHFDPLGALHMPSWKDIIDAVSDEDDYTQSPFTTLSLYNATGTIGTVGYNLIDTSSLNSSYNLINYGGWSVVQLLQRKDYYNFPSTLASNVLWQYKIPEYDRSTYLLSVIGFVLGVGVLVTATVVSTLAVRRVIRNERMRYEFRLKEAYDNAMKDPTPANLNAYQRLSFEANIFSFITDGSMYSRTSFWDRSGSNSRTTLGSVASKIINGLVSKRATSSPANAIQDGDSNNIVKIDNAIDGVKLIYTSITGNHL